MAQSNMVAAAPGLILQFDKIFVNAMETNSGIFVGTNNQYAWNAHSKTNASISSISGDGNEFQNTCNVIFDDDAVDTPIDDRDLTVDARRMVQA